MSWHALGIPQNTLSYTLSEQVTVPHGEPEEQRQDTATRQGQLYRPDHQPLPLLSLRPTRRAAESPKSLLAV